MTIQNSDLSLTAAAIPADIQLPASFQHIRNATAKLNYAGNIILIDPMFSGKGVLGSIAGEKTSPLVDLPVSADEILEAVDLVLITHTHRDHLDQAAIDKLDKNIEIFNQPADTEFMLTNGFVNATTIQNTIIWHGITITRTTAEHGTGRILEKMGQVSGFVLQAKELPTLYFIGDAIWTQDIYLNIAKYKPDYIIVNSGGAAMPSFEATPILMDELQTLALVQESGNATVIAVHMEAIDHCRTTRTILRETAARWNISDSKLLIPADGETLVLN